MSEIGTKGGPLAAEMVTQWGPLKRIFENELSIEKKRIFVYLKFLQQIFIPAIAPIIDHVGLSFCLIWPVASFHGLGPFTDLPSTFSRICFASNSALPSGDPSKTTPSSFTSLKREYIHVKKCPTSSLSYTLITDHRVAQLSKNIVQNCRCLV